MQNICCPVLEECNYPLKINPTDFLMKEGKSYILVVVAIVKEVVWKTKIKE